MKIDFFPFLFLAMSHVGSQPATPGIEWLPSALDVWSLNHWIAWEVPKINFKLTTFLNGATQKSEITYVALGVFL